MDEPTGDLWVVDSGGAMKPCIRQAPGSPRVWGSFGGISQRIMKYREFLA